jgi:putative heme iron utilization protein
VTGLDPDGLDLACGDAVLRLEFSQRVTGAGQLREILADLAKQARGS